VIYIQNARAAQDSFVDDKDFSRLEGKDAANPEIKGPAVEIFACFSTMSC
jgi:hypothetical protein